MSGAEVGLAVSVYLACAVEAVEALTIVLAVGQTRNWPAALSGAGAAVVLLAAVVGGLGSAITQLPIDTLRVVVGVLLLSFGAQWLRKAVLRAAGRKALHDELGIYASTTAEARDTEVRGDSFDFYSFAVAFKGVWLEGMEVALIVITFGANQHHTGLAAIAAGLAVASVVLAGAAVRRPLARVPENTMKFAVGVMLCSFGLFWGAEGLGLGWPGGEAFLLAIIAALLAAALAAVAALSRTAPG